MDMIYTDENGNDLMLQTSIFDVVKCPEVESGFRPIKVKSHDWVCIIVEKDGKYLMEKQLRYGINMEVEEFPCGTIEDNEQPLYAARRELLEETGIAIAAIYFEYLGRFATNPAFMNNYMHYFYINLDHVKYEQQDPMFDEHEHLITCWKDKNLVLHEMTGSPYGNVPVILGCALWQMKQRGHIQ